MGHKVPQSQYFHGLWHSFFFSTVKDGIIVQKGKKYKGFTKKVHFFYKYLIKYKSKRYAALKAGTMRRL